MRWPGHIPANSTCRVPVISIDYMSTFAEVAGAPAGAVGETDGASLAPLFSENGSLPPRNLFFFYPHYIFGSDFGKSTVRSHRPATAVRRGNYKLIDYFEDPQMTELYNLKEDVSEKTNLARTMPEKVKELRALINEWHAHVNADLPVPRPHKEYDNTRFGQPLGISRKVKLNE
jgi:arylsulfatase A-like enzyme